MADFLYFRINPIQSHGQNNLIVNLPTSRSNAKNKLPVFKNSLIQITILGKDLILSQLQDMCHYVLLWIYWSDSFSFYIITFR